MIRSIFSGVLLSCVFSLLVFGQQNEIPGKIALAESQAGMGNYTKALVILEDILVMQPSNLQAQEMKINILVQQERSKDALKDVEEYIQMYPGQPEYLYLRAVLNLQRQKYSKAIQDFDRALQLNMPESSVYKIYLNRGMAHFYNQDFDLAENDFSEVIERDSRNAAAYHGKGMVKYELHEYENAIVEFQRALKLEPDNPITHYNLAMSYFRMDDDENACYHFNKSCALGHRNACRLFMMECDINISE